MSLFNGLCGFPITPADPQGRVDTEALARLVTRLADSGVASVGLLGSTGTYVYLSREERRRAIEAAAEALGGKAPLMAGVGALRTDAALDLARDARKAGADGVLLAPVSYLPLTEEEVFAHFQAVAAETETPLCVYNNPTTTGFTFTPELLGRLAAIPNVVAVKNPAPAGEDRARMELENLRAAVPHAFSIGVSGDWNSTESMIAGADAWYSVLGGLFPAPLLEIVRAAQAGEPEEARRLGARLEPLWVLFRELSSFRVIYAAANSLGLCACDPPLPIRPLSAENRRRVETVLSELGLA